MFFPDAAASTGPNTSNSIQLFTHSRMVVAASVFHHQSVVFYNGISGRPTPSSSSWSTCLPSMLHLGLPRTASCSSPILVWLLRYKNWTSLFRLNFLPAAEVVLLSTRSAWLHTLAFLLFFDLEIKKHSWSFAVCIHIFQQHASLVFDPFNTDLFGPL
jgi:hypothetical protein